MAGISSGRFDRDWGRSRTDQGIAGGNRPGPGFDFDDDVGADDTSGYDYNDDVLDAVVGTGLLDSGWDDDEAYQGEMMDAYDYDPSVGTRFGDWFERNNPLISLTRKLGFNAELDRTLGTANRLDAEGNRIGESDRDDQVAENACAAAGGTWDGGTCVMPSDDISDDVTSGDIGDFDPFASLQRAQWTHPLLNYGQDSYSGTNPGYVSNSIWDYKPPQLVDWTQNLRKWGAV